MSVVQWCRLFAIVRGACRGRGYNQRSDTPGDQIGLLKQTILSLMIYSQCCLAPDHFPGQAIQLFDVFILITNVTNL